MHLFLCEHVCGFNKLRLGGERPSHLPALLRTHLADANEDKHENSTGN